MDWKKYGAIAVLVILVAAIVVLGVSNANKLSDEEVALQVSKSVSDAKAPLNAEIASLNEDLGVLSADKATAETALIEVEGTVAELQTQVDALVAEQAAAAAEAAAAEAAAAEEEATTEAEQEAATYEIDGVKLTGTFKGTVDSDDLISLYFKTIEYDDEDYDVEEILQFTADFTPVLNVEDFGADIAVQADEEALIYKVVFDKRVKLNGDDDLVINFLGKELSIVSSDVDEIEFRTSQEITLGLGEETTYEGKVIKVIGFDDANKNRVLVSVDGDMDSLKEGESAKIGDLRVEAKDVFVSSIGDYTSATLYVGDDLSETIEDGDEYETDDRYEWLIDSNANGIKSIGVMLVEAYVENDEVFALGDSLSLPEDYKTITFDSLRELDVTDLDISVRKDKIKVEYDGTIEIKGKKIDNSKFVYNTDTSLVEYEYRGVDLTVSDLSKIKIIVEDRKVSFNYDVGTKLISIDSYDFGYAVGAKEITSAPAGDEDADYRFDNGDILYKSDANNGDYKETSVKIGLVNDEDKEVVLTVQ